MNGDDDEMTVVTRAVDGGRVTEGTLVSLLAHVYHCDREEAADMVATADEEDVIEEVRPSVYQAGPERDDRPHEASNAADE